MLATIEQVIEDFDSYVRNWSLMADEIPYEIKTSIIAQIIRTGSIDTTRFIQSVDFREEISGGGYRYLIDNSRDEEVYYSGFLEFDGETRTWTGRYNFRDGIENSNIERVTDEIADISFAR